MDGGINDHWIHLEAARSLQESMSRFRLLSRQTRQLNTICKMLRLFAQTVQAIPRFESSPVEYTGLDNLGLDDLEACIEFTYGITHFLANAIFKIFHLSQCLAHCHENAYPEALLDACEALGDELLSWKIESESFSTIDATDERMLGVAKAQATAFYNATLIYYFRSIQRCERKELRAEQRATLEAMNLAEDLKSNSPQHHHWPAPITWPAFIASCEAEDGDRLGWSRWWARVQDYRMNNYLKQRGIVERIWQRIDDSDISIDWREILAEMDIMVIAV
jgi:arginine metabolism regulation protein II